MAVRNDSRSTEEKEGLEESFQVPPVPVRRPVPFFITFVVMLIMWVIFSGKFDAFHLSLGVISCLIVAWLSSNLLIQTMDFKGMGGICGRYLLYIPWLLFQIMMANIHMLKLVFHPKMTELINPRLIHFKSSMTNINARVTLANSITLTPGTITVKLSVFGDFTVHAIDDASAAPLPGEMEERISHIFGE